MGTIKDLVDLTTQLVNSIKDRKFASDLNAIQSLVAQLQSEQATLHETNIEIREERLSLKQRILELEVENKSLAEARLCITGLTTENAVLKSENADLKAKVDVGKTVMSEFKAGDPVRLKSGGPIMTIEIIDLLYDDNPGSISAWCQWFGEKHKVERGVFVLSMLEHID